MTLGELIKQYIDERGMTYEQFGRMCNLSKGYISMLVNNRNPNTGKAPEPKIQTYHDIARAFGVPLNVLFRKIDNAPIQIDADDKIVGGSEERLHRLDLHAAAQGESDNPEMLFPDLNRAAIKAAEILVKYKISATPIIPLPIIKAIPHVFVVSFTEMADPTGLDRDNLVTLFGAENQDAVTYVKTVNGELHYSVAYNQRLPFYMIQLALARELGHIVLEHNGSKPEDVRTAEALYFARHLLCPRPLVKSMLDSGMPLTVEIIGNITGCYGRSIAGFQRTPGAHVPAELNRKVKAQFADYIKTFSKYHALMPVDSKATQVNFGTYMDNYED